MRYYIPTEIFYETGCVKNHGKEISRLGSKCLIVTGRNSAKITGALNDILEVLENEKIERVIFDEIEENPSVETVMKVRKLGVDHKVDFVIGIGGGSPLDASKAIALMIKNQEKDEEALYKERNLESLPVVAIPTTAGTGSEVTPYAILTLHKERTKRSISHRIFPSLALVDYKYLQYANDSIIVNTAVDALAHLIESNLNTNADEYSKIFSEHGLMLWARVKECLIRKKFTDINYDNLMNASTIAGMAIAYTGTSLPHGFSYAVTYEDHVPHGKAVGIFLPGFLDIYQKNDARAVKRVLELLEFESVEKFSEYIFTLLGKVVISDELHKYNVKSILNNQGKMANYPFKINENELIGILGE